MRDMYGIRKLYRDLQLIHHDVELLRDEYPEFDPAMKGLCDYIGGAVMDCDAIITDMNLNNRYL